MDRRRYWLVALLGSVAALVIGVATITTRSEHALVVYLEDQSAGSGLSCGIIVPCGVSGVTIVSSGPNSYIVKESHSPRKLLLRVQLKKEIPAASGGEMLKVSAKSSFHLELRNLNGKRVVHLGSFVEGGDFPPGEHKFHLRPRPAIP